MLEIIEKLLPLFKEIMGKTYSHLFIIFLCFSLGAETAASSGKNRQRNKDKSYQKVSRKKQRTTKEKLKKIPTKETCQSLLSSILKFNKNQSDKIQMLSKWKNQFSNDIFHPDNGPQSIVEIFLKFKRYHLFLDDVFDPNEIRSLVRHVTLNIELLDTVNLTQLHELITQLSKTPFPDTLRKTIVEELLRPYRRAELLVDYDTLALALKFITDSNREIPKDLLKNMENLLVDDFIILRMKNPQIISLLRLYTVINLEMPDEIYSLILTRAHSLIDADYFANTERRNTFLLELSFYLKTKDIEQSFEFFKMVTISSDGIYLKDKKYPHHIQGLFHRLKSYFEHVKGLDLPLFDNSPLDDISYHVSTYQRKVRRILV
jgi:hypothetical protein